MFGIHMIGNVSSRHFQCAQCLLKRISPLRKSRLKFLTSSASSLASKEWAEPVGCRTGIKIYNTLTKQKEELILPNGRIASWYACGPTVYDSTHIGHASSYVRQDIIRRILTDVFDIDVMLVQGITDIDDKIINKANETGEHYLAIARYYEREFYEEMGKLNVLPPTVSYRVTDHIPHIVDFIRRIEARGCAYTTESGTVLFDIKKYGRYGQFKIGDSTIYQQRLLEKNKRNPQDFVLWKPAKRGEPSWESPWGDGRPGWHIECSTMASMIFGPSVDIHSGGEDLMFPHHENEIAQSCCYFNSPQWANYWIHTGYLHQEKDPDKMSKSLKNYITLPEMLRLYTPAQFRLLCLMNNYRGRIEYSTPNMVAAKGISIQIQSFLQKCDAYLYGQLEGQEFSEAELLQRLSDTKEIVLRSLADDFNTRQAMDALMKLLKFTDQYLSSPKEGGTKFRNGASIAAVSVYVKHMLRTLGYPYKQKKARSMDVSNPNVDVKDIIDDVMKFRTTVRRLALDPPMDAFENLPDNVKKAQKHKIAKPLMDACDLLRKRLTYSNINVQDYRKDSSWEFTEQSKLKK